MKYEITVISCTPPTSNVYTVTVFLSTNKILIFSFAVLFLKLCMIMSHMHMTAIGSWLFPNETQYSENPVSVLNLSVNKFWSVLLPYYIWPWDLQATKLLSPIYPSRASSTIRWVNDKSINVSRTQTSSQNVGLLTGQPADAAAVPRKIYRFTCHESCRMYKC